MHASDPAMETRDMGPSEQQLANARKRLLEAGLSEEQIEIETGLGLRSAPCPPVARLVVKVATGALSLAGAIRLTEDGVLR